MAVYQLSLAFNWAIPATMLYAFDEVDFATGVRTRLALDGASLSHGRFLIDRFANSGDEFIFQLFEWTAHGEPPEELHSRPTSLKVFAKNFQVDNLFTTPVEFNGAQFLDPAEPVASSESPFPGLTHLYCWLSATSSMQLFPTAEFSEPQVFEISARAVVAHLPEDGNLSARSFLFDPEMIIGSDGGPS